MRLFAIVTSGTAHLFRVAVITVSVLGLAVAVVVAAKALLVLFGGFLLSLVLNGAASTLARLLHVRYGICLALVLLVLLGAAVALVFIAGPALTAQFAELVDRLPSAIHDVLARIRAASGTGLPELNSTPGLPNVQAVASKAFTAVGASVELLGAFVVVLFVGIYGAASPRVYERTLLAIVPRHTCRDALRVMREVTRNLTRWLFGRLLAMAFVGISCAIVFSILRVPAALSLAVLAGLLTFVEYVGAVVSAIPPTLLAYTRSPTSAIVVLVLFSVLHVIEGYVLTPLLARASVRFPPALTLAGQTFMAALLGPLGLTFSTPLWIVVVSAVRAVRRNRNGRRSWTSRPKSSQPASTRSHREQT